MADYPTNTGARGGTLTIAYAIRHNGCTLAVCTNLAQAIDLQRRMGREYRVNVTLHRGRAA